MIHKEFYGKNTEQMALLIKEGFKPMSVRQLMKFRIEALKSKDQTQIDYWCDHYFDTCDAIAYKDDRVKVVFDAQPLREMNARSELSNGALILLDGAYEALEGPEFTRKELVPYIGKRVSEAAVRENPVWQALAGGDQALLNAYAAAIFKEAKRYNYDENMGIYVVHAQKQPTMRAWVVNNLYYWSNAYGDNYLDLDGGRLVGVAPEAQGNKRGITIPSFIDNPSLKEACLWWINTFPKDIFTGKTKDTKEIVAIRKQAEALLRRIK